MLTKKQIQSQKKRNNYAEADKLAQAEFERKISQFDSKKLVYLDETGFREDFKRMHAYSRRGVAVNGIISGRKYARTNFVGGLHNGQIIAAKFYAGSMKSLLFEDWFENQLLKRIPHNRIIIMDNATFHRKKKLRQLARKYNCQAIFLPPYSPQLNPIEPYWANVKRHLRTNTFESLISAICSYFKIN